MTVTCFGVRHHGPGSARALERALAELEPDAVLIEGPPDADAILPVAGDDAMLPPVALLVRRGSLDFPSREPEPEDVPEPERGDELEFDLAPV